MMRTPLPYNNLTTSCGTPSIKAMTCATSSLVITTGILIFLGARTALISWSRGCFRTCLLNIWKGWLAEPCEGKIRAPKRKQTINRYTVPGIPPEFLLSKKNYGKSAAIAAYLNNANAADRLQRRLICPVMV